MSNFLQPQGRGGERGGRRKRHEKNALSPIATALLSAYAKSRRGGRGGKLKRGKKEKGKVVFQSVLLSTSINLPDHKAE